MTSLLSIYDFCSQPLSVGDMIVFSEGSLVIAESMGFKKIDFCLFYDKEIPHADPNFQEVLNTGGHLHFALKYGSLLQFNPYINSIILLQGVSELERFLNTWPTLNQTWPSLDHIKNRHYVNYDVHQFVAAYHRNHKSLPALTVPEPHKSWCENLINKTGKFPVSVNLRNNPKIDPARNSQMNEWLDFFKRVNHLPVQFYILCEYSEIHPEMLELQNVTFLKALGSSLEQDMAMVLSSNLHMGSSSGPTALASFTGKPYIIFNTTNSQHIPLYKGAKNIDENGDVRTAWATPFQKFTTHPEKADEIFQEFMRMYESCSSGG